MNKETQNKEKKKISDELNMKLAIIEGLHNLTRVPFTKDHKTYLEELAKTGEYIIRAQYGLYKLENPNLNPYDTRMLELLDRFSGTNTTYIGYAKDDEQILTELSKTGEFMVRAKLELAILKAKNEPGQSSPIKPNPRGMD